MLCNFCQHSYFFYDCHVVDYCTAYPKFESDHWDRGNGNSMDVQKRVDLKYQKSLTFLKKKPNGVFQFKKRKFVKREWFISPFEGSSDRVAARKTKSLPPKMAY